MGSAKTRTGLCRPTYPSKSQWSPKPKAKPEAPHENSHNKRPPGLCPSFAALEITTHFSHFASRESNFLDPTPRKYTCPKQIPHSNRPAHQPSICPRTREKVVRTGAEERTRTSKIYPSPTPTTQPKVRAPTTNHNLCAATRSASSPSRKMAKSTLKFSRCWVTADSKPWYVYPPLPIFH